MPQTAVQVLRLDPGAQVVNPAGAYCSQVLGYRYEIATRSDGSQDGYCVLPDQSRCEQWDFYAGRCGKAYSACAQRGLQTFTRRDGADPFSNEYSVCAAREGKGEQLASQLVGLEDRIGLKLLPLSTAIPSQLKVQPNKTAVQSSLPAELDWRNYRGGNWLSPVKNQANCGSCWAFAAVSVAESYQKILQKNSNLVIDLSEQDVLTCSDAGNCENGGVSYSAMRHIQSKGVVDEACSPYQAVDGPCGSGRCADWQSRRSYIGPIVETYPVTGRDAMKQQILDNGPAVFYLGINSDVGGYWDSNQVYRCTNPSINHAVTVVGWSDSGGYWILKNSWGSGWGPASDGYFHLGYGECNGEAWGVMNVQHPPVAYSSWLYLSMAVR